MSFTAQPRRPTGPPSSRRRRGPLVPTLVVLAGLAVLLLFMAQIWTEVLWYNQVGYTQVLRTEWFTRATLFVLGFALMAGGVATSLRVAYHSRPVYAPTTPEQASLDQYREAVEPLRKVVMVAGPALLGFFAGAAASQQWTTVQLWMNGVDFGREDPQYGMDLSFFVFTLPGLRFVVSFLMAVVVLSAIGGIATQYLYGGIRVGGQGPHTTRAARVQISVLAALLLLLIAANYWLDRYSLLMRSGEKFEGASYADVNAVIPSKAILAVIAIVVAIAFLVTAVRGNWRIPAIGVGLMIVSAIAIGGIYPAVVQQFQVEPNAQELEATFIQRNIDATKTAFGLDDVEVTPYSARTEATPGALREDAETAASIRLLDPTIVSPSFRQLQQNKQYYAFPNTLAVDRYDVGGESRDTVIAVRELDLGGLGAGQRTWVNDHTVYTHGFGVVAAYGNSTSEDGQPAFYEGGIPPVGELGEYEPRIYFGQESPTYSIVGAPGGDPTQGWELDYPDDEAGGQVNTSFPTDDVDAGPSVGNMFNKLLFALKFGDEELLFSDRVTEESQILYDRDPRQRVEKVAPYLTIDGRVYPAVVDGRVLWMVDGYTTTDAYPYSASARLDDVTTDSLTARGNVAELLPQRANYIRNSVKATVDAYSGDVTLYAWDTEDPLLQAWNGIFPNTIRPISDISGELMSHVRYPEDLFKIQRTLLATYHVDDAGDFYTGQDFWTSPNDPTQTAAVPQPPYYLTLQMPGQEQPSFSLTSTFIPQGGAREVLTGFLAADAEAGDVAGQPAEGYGKLRLLELPRNSTVSGPGQVQNQFNSDPEVSRELNLLRQGDSNVLNGNLLTLPVGGGLMYVQPVYVQSSTGTQYPLLRKVLVAFGDTVGFANTLGEALDQVFGGNSGADIESTTTDVGPTAPDPEAEGTDAGTDTGGEAAPEPTTEPSPTPTATQEPAPPAAPPADAATARQQLDQALTDANAAITEGEAALAAGDFAAYGEAQQRLQDALERAVAAEEQLGE